MMPYVSVVRVEMTTIHHIKQDAAFAIIMDVRVIWTSLTLNLLD